MFIIQVTAATWQRACFYLTAEFNKLTNIWLKNSKNEKMIRSWRPETLTLTYACMQVKFMHRPWQVSSVISYKWCRSLDCVTYLSPRGSTVLHIWWCGLTRWCRSAPHRCWRFLDDTWSPAPPPRVPALLPWQPASSSGGHRTQEEIRFYTF